ncbi:MAG TPA: response regulator transcription factor [Dehalococcoidia bacterium]|nr:response regulator transcription factor [Dehalococcoidia bacterium]
MAILVVDTDADLIDLICYTFRRGGLDVIPAYDGNAALKLWQTKGPELLLLDLEVPRVSGWEVCKQVCRDGSTPVIVLSALNAEKTIAQALELGADDYITKPFSFNLLLARVRAVLRRVQRVGGAAVAGWQALSSGDLVLDTRSHSVTRAGQPLRLTVTEFKLLQELMVHAGQVLPYQTLVDRVWGYDDPADAGLLRGHVLNLRRKLEDGRNGVTLIHTVYGVGYSFRRESPEELAEAALPVRSMIAANGGELARAMRDTRARIPARPDLSAVGEREARPS